MRLLLAVLVALLLVAPAYSARSVAMDVRNQKGDVIQGSMAQKGREGKIMVIAVSHDIVSPRDAASGLPTGKRMHKPFVITKELDKSTPLIAKAMVDNQVLQNVTLTYWAPSTTVAGSDEVYYKVTLTNARIASISVSMQDNRLYDLQEQETISFTYQKIEWTWINGGITAMDDWESPVA